MRETCFDLVPRYSGSEPSSFWPALIQPRYDTSSVSCSLCGVFPGPVIVDATIAEPPLKAGADQLRR